MRAKSKKNFNCWWKRHVPKIPSVIATVILAHLADCLEEALDELFDSMELLVEEEDGVEVRTRLLLLLLAEAAAAAETGGEEGGRFSRWWRRPPPRCCWWEKRSGWPMAKADLGGKSFF